MRENMPQLDDVLVRSASLQFRDTIHYDIAGAARAAPDPPTIYTARHDIPSAVAARLLL